MFAIVQPWSSHAYISHYLCNDLRSRVKYLKFVPVVARYVDSTLSSGTTRRFAIQTNGNFYSCMGMDWIFRMANSWARFGDVTINGCVMEPLVEHWRTCLRDKGSFSREPRLTIHSTKASYEWKCFDSICATPEGCFRFRNSSTMFWRWTLQVLISLVKRKGQGIQWCFFSIFAFCARIPFR